MKKIIFFTLALMSVMTFELTHASHGSGMDSHNRNTAVPSVKAMHLPEMRTASK